MYRSIAIFSVLILLVVIVTTAAVYEGKKTGELERKVINPISQTFTNYWQSLAKAITEPPNDGQNVTSDSNSEVEIFLNEISPTPTEAPKVQNQPIVNQNTKPCYRYTVVHLDGSTSNLCYSQSDYNALVNLGYSLASAKTFYQFHLDGVQRYQDEKDRTGSDFWLSAKASQEQQAQREKEKIGQITLQMQEIEARGY